MVDIAANYHKVIENIRAVLVPAHALATPLVGIEPLERSLSVGGGH